MQRLKGCQIIFAGGGELFPITKIDPENLLNVKLAPDYIESNKSTSILLAVIIVLFLFGYLPEIFLWSIVSGQVLICNDTDGGPHDCDSDDNLHKVSPCSIPHFSRDSHDNCQPDPCEDKNGLHAIGRTLSNGECVYPRTRGNSTNGYIINGEPLACSPLLADGSCSSHPEPGYPYAFPAWVGPVCRAGMWAAGGGVAAAACLGAGPETGGGTCIAAGAIAAGSAQLGSELLCPE